MSWRLEIKKPGASIERVTLNNGTNTIGRSDCSINLDDKKVSRHHCTIFVNASQAILVDNNSSNGTFVNGIKIENKELVHFDNIVIGLIKIKVVKIEDNS